MGVHYTQQNMVNKIFLKRNFRSSECRNEKGNNRVDKTCNNNSNNSICRRLNVIMDVNFELEDKSDKSYSESSMDIRERR